MTITKKKLSKVLSKELDISKIQSDQFINKFISILKETAQDKKTKISGFGTFYIKKTQKRLGRNPKTKETYIIDSTRRLSFIPSTILKKIIN